MRGKHHKDMAEACSSRSVISFFRPQVSQMETEAEALWAAFVVKHNLAFTASDHATKLFPKIFPDSEFAKNIICLWTLYHYYFINEMKCICSCSCYNSIFI